MTKMYGILSASCLATVARSQDPKLLPMGRISTIFKTEPGEVAHGWDVLTAVKVAEHAACFDNNNNNNDEFCEPQDQAERNQQIAQGALLLLSLTTPPEAVLRSTAFDENDGVVPAISWNDIDPDVTWNNMMLGIERQRSFDAWYQATQKHLDEPGTTQGENEFRPATSVEIAELFALLESQPEEGSIQRFMILYDQLLDLIFDLYYQIAKGLDGDGDPETWNNLDKAEAQEAFTLHNFLYPTMGFDSI